MTFRGALRRLSSQRRVRVSASLLAVIGLMAALAGPIASLGPRLLGLDGERGALFTELVLGSRTALGLGLGVAIASLFAGGIVGALAGLRGGLWDSLIARWVEAVGVFPAVILAALLRAMEPGPSLLSLFAVATLVRSAEMARLVRLLVVEGQTAGWSVAARALGASRARVLWHHILPNGVGTLFVSAFFSIGSVVLLETALSFLGLGVPAETASWGRMLGEIRTGANLPFLVAPVLALVVTLSALASLGDALRDEFDPRGRR